MGGGGGQFVICALLARCYSHACLHPIQHTAPIKHVAMDTSKCLSYLITRWNLPPFCAVKIIISLDVRFGLVELGDFGQRTEKGLFVPGWLYLLLLPTVCKKFIGRHIIYVTEINVSSLSLCEMATREGYW